MNQTIIPKEISPRLGYVKSKEELKGELETLIESYGGLKNVPQNKWDKLRYLTNTIGGGQ